MFSENDMKNGNYLESTLSTNNTSHQSSHARKMTQDENDSIGTCCPTETSPLLKSVVSSKTGASAIAASRDSIEEQREDTTASGDIHTTWLHEFRTIASYAAPLIATFVLQYLVDISGIIAAGRIGKIELGAVTCLLILYSRT